MEVIKTTTRHPFCDLNIYLMGTHTFYSSKEIHELLTTLIAVLAVCVDNELTLIKSMRFETF